MCNPVRKVKMQDGNMSKKNFSTVKIKRLRTESEKVHEI
jgi:hypothetical protein